MDTNNDSVYGCSSGKYAVLTLSTDNRRWMYDVTNATKERYCSKHGIDFIFCGRSLDDTRHPSWSKILLILRNIKKYDYILWLDDDAFFLREDYDIAKLFSGMTADNGKYLTMSRDWNGFNAGVMAIRCCNDAESMLNWVWSDYPAYPFLENSAIWHYLDINPACLYEFSPHSFFNGYTRGFHSGYDEYLATPYSLIAHLAGGDRTKSDTDLTLSEINRYVAGFR